MSMFIDIAVGDTLKVGDMIVRLQFKTGKKARLKIDVPGNLSVDVKKEQTEPT